MILMTPVTNDPEQTKSMVLLADLLATFRLSLVSRRVINIHHIAAFVINSQDSTTSQACVLQD